MNDLKTGLKLMRYTYGIRSNCIQAGVFLLMGLVFALSGEKGTFGFFGGYFWVCIAILPTQLIYTLGVSHLVQASPMKRKVQTVFPVAINLAFMIVIYLIEIAIGGIYAWGNPQEAEGMYQSLLLLATVMALTMVYLGACYKYFVVPTLCLIPVLIIWMQGGMGEWTFTRLFLGRWNVSLGMAVAVGFGILIAGALAEYLLTLLFYRAPLSRMAQAAPLRKAL